MCACWNITGVFWIDRPCKHTRRVQQTYKSLWICKYAWICQFWLGITQAIKNLWSPQVHFGVTAAKILEKVCPFVLCSVVVFLTSKITKVFLSAKLWGASHFTLRCYVLKFCDQASHGDNPMHGLSPWKPVTRVHSAISTKPTVLEIQEFHGQIGLTEWIFGCLDFCCFYLRTSTVSRIHM